MNLRATLVAVVRDAGLAAYATAVQRAIPLLVGLIIAKTLGPEQYGRFGLFINLVATMSVVATAGLIPTILVQTRSATVNGGARAGSYVGAVILIYGSCVLLAAIGMYMGLQFGLINKQLIGVDRFFVFATLSSLVGASLFSISVAIDHSLRQYGRPAAISSFLCFSLVGTVIVLALAEARYGTILLAYSVVYCGWALAICGLVLRAPLDAIRHIGQTGWGDIAGEARQLFSKSVPVAAYVLLPVLGLFVLLYRLGEVGLKNGDTAIVTMGIQWYSVVVFVPGALAGYMIPRLAHPRSAGATKNARVTTKATQLKAILAAYGLMSSVLCALFSALSAPIVGLYRHSESAAPFLPGAPGILRYFFLAGALAGIAAALNQFLFSNGRRVDILFGSIVWTAALLVGQQLLGLNAEGSAQSMVLSYGITIAALGVLALRAVTAR